MSNLKRAVVIFLVISAAAGTLSLARWQLRRLADRRASNRVMLAARALPPLLLPSPTGIPPAIDSGRRLSVRGHFDTTDQVILRGRALSEQPGIHVATAFVIDSSTSVIWVLRGFASSPDALTPPAIIAPPVAGVVTLTGLALALPETTDSGYPLRHEGVTTWQRLDRRMLQKRRPGSLSVYLLLATTGSENAGHLAIVAPAEMTDGPHLSYAIQWFGITVAILSFGVLVLWRDRRGSPRPGGAA